MDNENKHEKYPHLFFKNGKAKRSMMLCRNKNYIKELQKINGAHIPSYSCGGLRCPFYSVGCPRWEGNW